MKQHDRTIVRARASRQAAVLRIGLQEIKAFIEHFYPKSDAPLLESCGVADLVRPRESVMAGPI